MPTEVKFPPSGRDFQVYERVVSHTASTREVAKEFSISQTRVRQIVKRVAQWLLEELPAGSEAADAAHLRLGLHMAADRMETLLGEAMAGWRAGHETKYFSLALRVITLQSKMPVFAGTIPALIADAIEGPLPEEEPRSEQPQPARPTESIIAPPVRDCSPNVENSPAEDSLRSQPPTATPSEPATSVELPDEIRAARQAFFGPAQQPAADAQEEAVIQLEITPQQPGARLERKLSRRERRRLARISA